MRAGFLPEVGEAAWAERDIKTDAELRDALAAQAAEDLAERRAERLAQSAEAAALQERIDAAVAAGKYAEAERLKAAKDELVAREEEEAAAARSATPVQLLGRALRLLLLPVRVALLSEVWAFYLLVVLFAYGVANGSIGPSLAWRGGLVLTFVGIVTWVSKHTMETPDRSVFLNEWREQTGRGPGQGIGADTRWDDCVPAVAKASGPKKND